MHTSAKMYYSKVKGCLSNKTFVLLVLELENLMHGLKTQREDNLHLNYKTKK